MLAGISSFCPPSVPVLGPSCGSSAGWSAKIVFLFVFRHNENINFKNEDSSYFCFRAELGFNYAVILLISCAL